MNAIFLIGYMGSGKSTTGKILANQLGCSFIDLDSFIEEIEQKSIPDIFSLFGEETFRLIEHNALKKLIKQNGNAVIACGGGTPCFHAVSYKHLRATENIANRVSRAMF